MTATSPTSHRFHYSILIFIVALAALLRCFNLSALGFWTDELFTLSEVDGWGFKLIHIPLNQIMPAQPVCTRLQSARLFTRIPGALARDDAHPPLYFLLLRGWECIFGDSESAVRSLNVLFSLVAIVLLFFAARPSVGSNTSLVACLLMAVATPQIQYSQEARNYMLALPLLLSAILCMQGINRCSNWKYAACFATCALAMMLTHYFAAGVLFAIAAYAISSFKGRSRRLVVASLIVAAIVYVSIWGPSILQQRSVIRSVTWMDDDAPGHLIRRFIDLCRLPVRYFFEATASSKQPFIAFLGGAFLLVLLPLYFNRRELRLWILCILLPIALILCADLSRSTTQLNWVRYSLFATPGAYVVLAGALHGKYRFLPAALVVVIAIVCLRNAYVPGWKTDYRTPVEAIGKRLTRDDGLIIVGADRDRDALIFSAFQHYLSRMPAACAVLTTAPDAGVLARMQQCRQVWTVCTWPDHFAGFPGYHVSESEELPYFASLILGRFDRTPEMTKNK